MISKLELGEYDTGIISVNKVYGWKFVTGRWRSGRAIKTEISHVIKWRNSIPERRSLEDTENVFLYSILIYISIVYRDI